MAGLYSVTSGSTAMAAAGSVKVAVALATGAQEIARVTEIDVTFNGVDAAAKPILVELVKTTAAPSGGSSYTPLKVQPGGTSDVTARINDTTDGSSPTIQQGYLIPATSGMSLQFPLGREPTMGVSEFWEVRITLQSGQAANNYLVNVWYEN